jgi:hypothetical protein
MVSVLSLWLPILLSAVAVFLASSVIHMVLRYHRADFRSVPDEHAALTALRSLGIQPGDYMMPYAPSEGAMKDPAFLEKMKTGPIVAMTVMPGGPPNMGSLLTKWFLYIVVVSLFAAYVAGRTLPAGTPYLQVFRVAGTVAFVGYSLALWQAAIWYGRSPSATFRSTLDGLIYGLLTGGVFGWLWPAM